MSTLSWLLEFIEVRPHAIAETSGDIMKVDDGYLWFRERNWQIAIHDSSNICPQEVGEAPLEAAAVASAGVVGMHYLVPGENVRAYVTIREGATTPTTQEPVQFARIRVGYKAPQEITVLNEIPLDATGKSDQVTLKRRVGGKPSASETTGGALINSGVRHAMALHFKA